jgi:spermidine synthase
MQLWYYEDYEDGVKLGLAAKEVLFRDKSDFQTVDVIETEAYGRMLLLDGLVMTTDKDEFVYHELISHVPALNHPKPERVVVIGGGDGGTVRELLKHPDIKEIVLCEIDGMVVEVCEKYFPEIAGGIRDSRVTLKIGDGIAYMADHAPGTLDLVIVDSTDPIGPGEGLFSSAFYRSVAKALKDDGLMVCQSEGLWHPSDVLQRIHRNVSAGFSHLYPYIASIPTYPKGTWSWTMASKKPIKIDDFDRNRLAKIEGQGKGLKYLNADLMTGVFALPNFFKAKLTPEKK